MALIRVALAQLNMSVGDLEANALKLLDAYEQSCDQAADLVVFSELAICGYPVSYTHLTLPTNREV